MVVVFLSLFYSVVESLASSGCWGLRDKLVIDGRSARSRTQTLTNSPHNRTNQWCISCVSYLKTHRAIVAMGSSFLFIFWEGENLIDNLVDELYIGGNLKY